MTEIRRIDQNARRSRATVHGQLVFLAGQVADDCSEPISGQMRQVLAKLDDLLARAGTDKRRLLSATIWVKSMADLEAINNAWDAWVAPGQAPARACARVELTRADYLVEITAIAAL